MTKIIISRLLYECYINILSRKRFPRVPVVLFYDVINEYVMEVSTSESKVVAFRGNKNNFLDNKIHE
jgi:hypothetical protein